MKRRIFWRTRLRPAIWIVRWRDRVYFIGILLVGMVLAVGAYPYDDPSVVGEYQAVDENAVVGNCCVSEQRPPHSGQRFLLDLL